jgi:hypothetical protein
MNPGRNSHSLEKLGHPTNGVFDRYREAWCQHSVGSTGRRNRFQLRRRFVEGRVSVFWVGLPCYKVRVGRWRAREDLVAFSGFLDPCHKRGEREDGERGRGLRFARARHFAISSSLSS